MLHYKEQKKDYLHDDSIPERLKIPAYWSHLVVIGDATPLHETSYIYIIVFPVAAIVLAILVFLILRRKKNKSPTPARRDY